MSRIKLIGVDLDGTVFNSMKEITEENKRAFRLCKKRGIAVVPVTGRPFSGLYEEHKRDIGCDYSINTNGSAVYRLSDNKRLVTHGIDGNKTRYIIDILDRFDCYYGIFIDGFGYLDETMLKKELEFRRNTPLYEYIKRTRKPIHNRREFISSLNYCDNIYTLADNTRERDRIREALTGISDIYYTSSIDVDVEIGGNCSKGATLLELAHMLGIDRAGIMAIGDSGNDLSMLEAAGLAVAMGNSSEEIKSAADFITKSCEDSGVAYAIEKLVLS